MVIHPCKTGYAKENNDVTDRDDLPGRSDIENLSLLDLDIEELESRLEMASLFHPMGYLCGVDGCTVNNNGNSNGGGGGTPTQPKG